MPLPGCLVTEDGELHGCRVEACKLQPCIGAGLVAGEILQRFRIGGQKRVADTCPVLVPLDQNETPRLAVADGGRLMGNGQKALHQPFGQRISTKAAHIAPPCDKFGQALPE